MFQSEIHFSIHHEGVSEAIHHLWRWLSWGVAVVLVLFTPAGDAAADPAPGRPTSQQAEVASTAAVHEPAHLGRRLLQGIEDGVARVEPWLQRYGYGAVFVAVGVEGFGIPLPGQTILEAGSALSASANARLRIGWILLAALLAASLGNSIGYLIGRSGGRGLLHRLRIDSHHLDQMEVKFDRYGGWLILFARFFDGTRQLNGIAAGILEMPWVRFTLFNLAGAALWVCFWGLGVYYLDLHLDQVVALIRRINPWVAVVTLTGLGVLAVLTWRRFSRRGKAPPR